MVQRARKNLEGFGVDVCEGSIRETDYSCDYFDATTCRELLPVGQAAERTNEIYRILKVGGARRTCGNLTGTTTFGVSDGHWMLTSRLWIPCGG